MKKILVLATAAFLFTGVSFGQEKKCDKKSCKKGSSCCQDKAKAKTEKKDKTTAKM